MFHSRFFSMDGVDGSSASAESPVPVRVLVVEDNADSAEALVLLLRMLGNEVQVATDGASGLQAAETHRPEIVLLDIGLPEMNGYDVARRIREQPWGGQMALVALTGWGQDEDRRLAKEAGFDYHLVKPVDPQVLMPLFQTLRAKKRG
jgi:CheY-like chemotaxis protein